MTLTAEPEPLAYDAIARFYDRFTAHHDYDTWVTALERLSLDNGLSGRRLLDVGCGTGKSFLPFAARGYEVVACDASAAMAAVAATKAPDVPIRVCDVREMPVLGSFDLIVSLDDCLNHLLEPTGLILAFERIARNLAPSGLVIFDVNTLGTFRSSSHAGASQARLLRRGRPDQRGPALGPCPVVRPRLTGAVLRNAQSRCRLSPSSVSRDGLRRPCVPLPRPSLTPLEVWPSVRSSGRKPSTAHDQAAQRS